MNEMELPPPPTGVWRISHKSKEMPDLPHLRPLAIYFTEPYHSQRYFQPWAFAWNNPRSILAAANRVLRKYHREQLKTAKAKAKKQNRPQWKKQAASNQAQRRTQRELARQSVIDAKFPVVGSYPPKKLAPHWINPE